LRRIFPGGRRNRIAVAISNQRVHPAARYTAVFGNRNLWQ
jgi:hypothetical protein